MVGPDLLGPVPPVTRQESNREDTNMSNPVGLPRMFIEGTLVADPELRFTPAGVPVTKFRVATNRRRFNKHTNAWEEDGSTFLTGSAWRNLAENVAESLTKGDRVLIYGELTEREWQTKEGEKRTSYEIDTVSMGPSLAFATAPPRKVPKAGPSRPTGDTADDPWATQLPASDEAPF